MIIFLSLFILWFLFFAYNKINFGLFWEEFILFFRLSMSHIERINMLILLIDILLLFIMLVYLIWKIRQEEKPKKKKTKKARSKVITKKQLKSKLNE